MKSLNSFRRLSAIAVAAASLFAGSFMFTSCKSAIGYGVVLWNITENNIPDGEVVPVYLQSNITRVVVIGVPGSKEKIEVPMWKVSAPQSKKKAQAEAAVYEPYRHKYARCTFDGLPIRQDKMNMAKQIYRLREGEVVRILEEGEGELPTNGKEVLEGKWVRVLANEGSVGWCFSHYLNIFSIGVDGSSDEVVEEAAEVSDEKLEMILGKKWYPENYAAMIKAKQIDLSMMKADWGFDTGKDSGKIVIKQKDVNVSYTFKGVEKKDYNTYGFTGTSVEMTIRGDDIISVRYSDSKGMPHTYTFVTVDKDVKQLINDENARRNREISSLYASYSSSIYGKLTIASGKTFTWTGYDQLVPSVISSSATGSGSVSIQYFLPGNLKGEWDGVVTFKFKGMSDEVNFLYKRDGASLRFSTASVQLVDDSPVVSRGYNSAVISFQR